MELLSRNGSRPIPKEKFDMEGFKRVQKKYKGTIPDEYVNTLMARGMQPDAFDAELEALSFLKENQKQNNIYEITEKVKAASYLTIIGLKYIKMEGVPSELSKIFRIISGIQHKLEPSFKGNI